MEWEERKEACALYLIKVETIYSKDILDTVKGEKGSGNSFSETKVNFWAHHILFVRYEK